MPHCEHQYVVAVWNVVHVISSALEQNPTRPWYRGKPIETADVGRVGDDAERCGQLVGKQVWRGRAIPSPPAVHFTDLLVCLRGGSDRQAHRRVRNSSRIADAGRRRPASADFQEADSASCKARRSSSVRSSPSSSTTRSTTVPSGRVVGSSRTSRPFSTRARRPLICLLYGFPWCPASVRASRGSPSIWRAKATAWFQLAGVRVPESLPPELPLSRVDSS